MPRTKRMHRWRHRPWLARLKVVAGGGGTLRISGCPLNRHLVACRFGSNINPDFIQQSDRIVSRCCTDGGKVAILPAADE